MNKKGNIIIIAIFFVILFLILFVGFLLATGNAILNWVFDVSVPELTNLGSVEGTNFTDISSYTITPLNTLVQNFNWMVGVLYVLMLVGSIGFALMFRMNPSRWLIGFYFMAALLLIIGAIFISNMYEDFYNDNDDLGTRLKEQTILSYMILYSPAVFTIIVFITGIILFSGLQQEEFV